VRGGKREAQRALAALIVEAGENGAPRRGTLVELPEEWFAHAEPDFSPKTAAETRRILDRTVIPRLGDRRVDKLRPSDLDALYGELRTTGGWAGRSLAPATVRRIHGIIHRALGQGVRWGWVAKNPAAQASPPRVPPPRIEPPSPADVAKLIELPAVASRRRDPRLRKAPRSGGPARRPASDLRHFVATRLLASGVDVRSVAGRLGHRNAATTLNDYSHFLTEPDREAAYLLGRLVRGEIDAQADPST